MIVKLFFNKIINLLKNFSSLKAITLYPTNFKKGKNFKGCVLISYITSPFTKKKNDLIFKSHTNQWECKQIVQTFLNLGFVVDVIHINNKVFNPKKKYKVYVDNNNTNLQRLVKFLDKDCIKIIHFTESHWLVHNNAEYSRLLDLKKRKNIVLLPRRTAEPHSGIEKADYISMIGNDYTVNTYSFLKKPIYKIPISSTTIYEFPKNKDFDVARNNFLWLGSMGMVHKGLDLVLEAFVQMPNFRLVVCGPINKEKDFEKEYFKELYQTNNIETIGWVDIEDSNFINIMNKSVAIIYPSCSEGQAGSVITCLHAGLIPIVSKQAGIDLHDFGFILNNSTIDEIKSKIKLVSELPLAELKKRSTKAWEYARATHTRENFELDYGDFIKKALNFDK